MSQLMRAPAVKALLAGVYLAMHDAVFECTQHPAAQ